MTERHNILLSPSGDGCSTSCNHVSVRVGAWWMGGAQLSRVLLNTPTWALAWWQWGDVSLWTGEGFRLQFWVYHKMYQLANSPSTMQQKQRPIWKEMRKNGLLHNCPFTVGLSRTGRAHAFGRLCAFAKGFPEDVPGWLIGGTSGQAGCRCFTEAIATFHFKRAVWFDASLCFSDWMLRLFSTGAQPRRGSRLGSRVQHCNLVRPHGLSHWSLTIGRARLLLFHECSRRERILEIPARCFESRRPVFLAGGASGRRFDRSEWSIRHFLSKAIRSLCKPSTFCPIGNFPRHFVTSCVWL